MDFDSAENAQNEEEFWSSLEANNDRDVVAVTHKIIDWLRDNEYRLWFHHGEKWVQLRIFFESESSVVEAKLRINSRGRLSSRRAEVRIQYEGMCGGLQNLKTRYALQRKIHFIEGFRVIGRDGQHPAWDPDYFKDGDAHFFVNQISGENVEGFFRVIDFCKQAILDEAFDPPAELTKYWDGGD